MSAPAPSFDRFLRALHRRFVFLRGAERVGLCVLTACGVSLLIAPVLFWAGRPMLPVTLFALGAAGGIGLIAAIVRRPTLLDTAMEADRQLQLSDLLGTALTVQNRREDPWAVTVLALAEGRCAELSSSTVLLHRWGARAWGGVGLAAALVLALGLISTQPNPSRASSSSIELFGHEDLNPSRAPTPSATYSAQHGPIARPTPRDDNPSSADAKADNTTAASAVSQSDGSANGTHQASASDPTGTGAGAGNTKGSHPTRDPGITAGTRGQTDGHGPTATGGQASDTTANSRPGDNTTGGSAGQSQSRTHSPPWATPDWPAAVQQAMDELQTHPDQDAYRDLIRDYFQRR